MRTSGQVLDHWANEMEQRGYRALAQLNIDFYPQYRIDRYIADAFLPKHRVVVEFDGPDHNSGDRYARDEIRDQFMALRGYYTLRIPYREMRRNTVAAVKAALEGIGIPSSAHFGFCTLSPDEIIAIEARQHMYLAGYISGAGMLFPVFRHRQFSEF